MKEWHDDALYDGRRVGASGRRRVRLGAAARGGMRGVPGGARGAVPARRAAQGAAGAGGRAGAAAVAGLLGCRPLWTNPVDAAELARVKQQSATLEQQLGRYDPDGR